MGRLDVRICEARNLPDTQVVGRPDPYCIVTCERQQFKTRTWDNNLNPRWDEVFKFQICDERSAQIRIEVWNKNVMSDEIMGFYTLSVSGLKRGLVSDQWVLLQRCRGNAELRIRLCALDFGGEPTPQELAMAGAIPMQGQPAYGVPTYPGQPPMPMPMPMPTVQAPPAYAYGAPAPYAPAPQYPPSMPMGGGYPMGQPYPAAPPVYAPMQPSYPTQYPPQPPQYYEY